MFGRGGRGGWRGRGRGFGPCGPGGAGRGFMGMMKNFMEKMGGEEQCKNMKQEFCNTMKNGSEAEKKEQWEKFGKVMEEFGQHMGANAEGMFDNTHGAKHNADGEAHSWNYQRAVL